ADYLVIGRPIRLPCASGGAVAAVERIVAELGG
ncbi:MAG: orotidine-5'-phosphate decarboxylase, partial [Chloroflexaceae bacterium]|nr:orotidine-5'-phosphate decarboxylase [Chloroflexaceae bacterium]